MELYDPRSKGFMPSNPGIGMHVEVRDPSDKIMMSKVSFGPFEVSICSGFGVIAV